MQEEVRYLRRDDVQGSEVHVCEKGGCVRRVDM